MTRLRFTDTDKWRDGWFRRLPSRHKMLWLYLCDTCDNAGVWEVDQELATFEMGQPIDLADALACMGDRILPIDDGRKWWLQKFITFQHPTGLTKSVSPHKNVIRLLERHGLDPSAFLAVEKSSNERDREGLAKAPRSQQAPDPAQTSLSGESAERGKIDTADLLARHGLPCGAKEAKEWAGGLSRTARCRSQAEADAFLEWAKHLAFQRSGVAVRYWRHVIELATEWDQGARPRRFIPAEPESA